MQSAEIPKNEADRLQALFDYDVLDSSPEVAYDNLTHMASSICGTPIALVSLIDESRQWFKSHHGLDATETPRELAFCAHAIHFDEIFEIRDSRQDERFRDNPLVTGAPEVIFYAGAQLKTPSGQNIGTLCVIDNKPSELNDEQQKQLAILAQLVVDQLELRKQIKIKEKHFNDLMTLTKSVAQHNAELDGFAARAAHDLHGPIRHIAQIARFCLDDLDERDTAAIEEDCRKIINRCDTLEILIRDIFDLTRANNRTNTFETINFEKLRASTLNSIEPLLMENNVAVAFTNQLSQPFSSVPIRLQQILYNLVSNGIKYSNPDRDQGYVNVGIEEAEHGISICVKDNGLGIPENLQDKVFEDFERLHTDIASGSGLGMSIVKKHVETLGGTITFKSGIEGTAFFVNLPQQSSHRV